MENSDEVVTSSIFPIVLEGTVEGTKIYVPFLTTGDAQNYVEHLVWAITKYRTKVDVNILQNGVSHGEIKSPEFPPVS